jgi:hypothetical protein
LNRLTPARLVILIALIGIFVMASRPSVDSDTWWHLRSGAWMVEHGQILTHDEFSHTRLGQPWINHSWLAQILLFQVWRWFSYAGLNLMTAAWVLLAFGLVYWQCEGNAYLKAFTLVLAAAASAVYWAARPQMISFVLAAVFLYLLYLFRWRGINFLWLLPPLMALWVNAHGGFAIGFMLLLMTLVGQIGSNLIRRSPSPQPSPHRGEGWGEGRTGTLNWSGIGWLAGIGLLCAAVVPLNPFGATMYLYPLRTVSIGALKDFIQEWQSPNFHQPGMQLFIWLLLATLAAIGLSRRRVDLTDFALLSGLVYLSFLAARNIPLFALVAPPVITRHAMAGLDELKTTQPHLTRWTAPASTGRGYTLLNWALLGLILAAALVKVVDSSLLATNQKFVAKSLPVEAARFIAQTHPAGPMFNSYNWGGYLAWTLYPDYPVYVDGRTDLYDDAFLREYLNVSFGRGYEAVFDQYGVKLVVIETNSLLTDRLSDDPNWHSIYTDELATVFVRQDR